MKNLYNFDDYIFDFDGVIFDTNFIKKDAITYASKDYLNQDDLNKFINYFLLNSGIPREKKIFKFFDKNTSKIINDNYSSYLLKSLLNADIVPGVYNFIKNLYNKNKYIHILSGGNINEIKLILNKNNMIKYFNNILAGPNDKQTNLNKLNCKNTTVFFGDSLHDYDIAMINKLNFVFVYGFTIQNDWNKNINKNNCLSIIKNFYKL